MRRLGKLKNSNNSKSKWIRAFKPSSIPTNVMNAVILMVLLTSKLPSEAEIQNLIKMRHVKTRKA